MNNPLTRLLQDLPEKWRLAIYALLFLGGVVFAALQAADGDWGKTIGLVLAALFGGAMPASNTPTVKAKTDRKRYLASGEGRRAAGREHGQSTVLYVLAVVVLVLLILWFVGALHR